MSTATGCLCGCGCVLLGIPLLVLLAIHVIIWKSPLTVDGTIPSVRRASDGIVSTTELDWTLHLWQIGNIVVHTDSDNDFYSGDPTRCTATLDWLTTPYNVRMHRQTFHLLGPDEGSKGSLLRIDTPEVDLPLSTTDEIEVRRIHLDASTRLDDVDASKRALTTALSTGSGTILTLDMRPSFTLFEWLPLWLRIVKAMDCGSMPKASLIQSRLQRVGFRRRARFLSAENATTELQAPDEWSNLKFSCKYIGNVWW